MLSQSDTPYELLRVLEYRYCMLLDLVDHCTRTGTLYPAPPPLLPSAALPHCPPAGRPPIRRATWLAESSLRARRPTEHASTRRCWLEAESTQLACRPWPAWRELERRGERSPVAESSAVGCVSVDTQRAPNSGHEGHPRLICVGAGSACASHSCSDCCLSPCCKLRVQRFVYFWRLI